MEETLDTFVDRLQTQILEDTREAYGAVAFERWLNPRHMGTLEDPDGFGRLRGVCGDTMELYLRFEADRVAGACYRTDGCGASSVCGSFAAELALGKTPDELVEISGDVILERIGGLPEEERHCAFLAAETLQEALHDYMLRQREAPGTEGSGV